MSGDEHKPAKSWPYDPAELSYKEWIALPEDEQSEVLRVLHQRRRERRERDGPLKGKELEAHDALAREMAREVRAEEERTKQIKPGWIVMGKGIAIHRLIRRLPPGWSWVPLSPPRKPQSGQD